MKGKYEGQCLLQKRDIYFEMCVRIDLHDCQQFYRIRYKTIQLIFLMKFKRRGYTVYIFLNNEMRFV